MSRESRVWWLRAIGLWFLLMTAETLQGFWRAKVLARWMGDAASRDLSTFTGTLIILLITFACIGWFPSRNTSTLLQIGAIWVLLTLSYEIVLGRVALHRTWNEIASDFDLLEGRLFPIGLLFLLFAPLIAARLRGRLRSGDNSPLSPKM